MFNMDAWRDYLERMRKADDTRWKSGGEGVSEHEIIITTGTTNKYDGDKSDRVNVKLTLAVRCQALEAENAKQKSDLAEAMYEYKALSDALKDAHSRMARMEARLREQDEFVARCHDIIGEESPGGVLTLDQRIAALKAQIAALKAERDDYRDGWIAVSNALNAANKDIVALKAENAKLRAALERVEWVGQGSCPWCNGSRHFLHHSVLHGGPDTFHAPDCQRQAALAQSEVKHG